MKLLTDKTDYMPGVPVEEKVRQLKKTSYVDFLTKIAKIHPDAVAYVLGLGSGGASNQAAGPDTYSAWYAWRRGQPGFAAMGLPHASQISNLVKDPGENIRFPDNAANAARLLVRWLIPDALPGKTMDDSILQRSITPCWTCRRTRCASACPARRSAPGTWAIRATAKEVEVTYLRDGKAYNVRARAVVMACFNAIVPYLVPELPETQKAALHMAVRMPLVSTNVAIRNWRAFQKLGVSNISCPGMFFTSIGLSVVPAIGGYRNPSTPDEPIVVSMGLANRIWRSMAPGFRRANSGKPLAPSSRRFPLRPSKATSSHSSIACWDRAASTPRATWPASSSTAGAMVMPAVRMNCTTPTIHIAWMHHG